MQTVKWPQGRKMVSRVASRQTTHSSAVAASGGGGVAGVGGGVAGAGGDDGDGDGVGTGRRAGMGGALFWLPGFLMPGVADRTSANMAESYPTSLVQQKLLQAFVIL